MKAYKCDICNAYCDDVLTVHGVCNPETEKRYEHLEGTSVDCCEPCYDKIMWHIFWMIKGEPKEENNESNT